MIAQSTTQQTIQLTNFDDCFVSIMGVRLRYWQAGERGTPVLLLHGLNGCVENWRWNIGALAQSHRVFALDGPGHGLSQPDERSLNLSFMRDLVMEFMRAHCVEQTNIVGLSGGGLIALKVAVDQPRFVEKLVLADAAGLGRGVNTRLRIFSMLPPPPRRMMSRTMTREQLRNYMLMAFFQNPDSLTSPMLDDFYANIRREHTMRAAALLVRWGIYVWGQKHEFSLHLRKIQSPALVIWGSDDRLFRASGAAAMPRIFRRLCFRRGNSARSGKSLPSDLSRGWRPVSRLREARFGGRSKVRKDHAPKNPSAEFGGTA